MSTEGCVDIYSTLKILRKYYYKKIQKAVQDAELEAGESAA
jgi:hypothetical protein